MARLLFWLRHQLRAQLLRPLLRPLLHQLRLFLLAVQFFTRIPIPDWVGFSTSWLQQSARYFPWVGILVGLVTAGVYWLAALCWPPLLAVLLSTVAGILLTGAFHEDGFADVCDGFGGGTTRERVFEIMKDSRVGAYGAIGIGLMLAIKCAALTELAEPGGGLYAGAAGRESGNAVEIGPAMALLLAHPLSRLFPTLMLWRMRYAREEGKAKPMAEHMNRGEFAIASMGALLPVLLLLALGQLHWPALLVGLGLAGLCCAWLVRGFWRRIGGFTGDCLGATQQVAEVALYLGWLAKCSFI